MVKTKAKATQLSLSLALSAAAVMGLATKPVRAAEAGNAADAANATDGGEADAPRAKAPAKAQRQEAAPKAAAAPEGEVVGDVTPSAEESKTVTFGDAGANQKAPDIEAWIAKVKAKNREKAEFRYPERILMVRDPRAKGSAIFPKISPRVFNKLGMFEIMDHAQLALQFQLNQKPHENRWAERSPDNLTRGSMPILFDLFDVDLIVAIPNVGPWEVYDAQNDEPLIVDETPPKDKLTSLMLNDWLNGRVGYDAYVVDQEGKYVLLKSQAKHMRMGMQALILKDSNEDFILRNKKTSGSGILQAVSSKDQYGVYKVVLSEESVEQLVPGTKIVLERPSE